MDAETHSRLPIFDTFKTKSSVLTGEALRQRAILAILAMQMNPTDRTRTAISKQIAGRSGIVWKNIYSGIFRDLEEMLIPAGIVEEEGRLPLKRGPKALQEEGVPYYRLTRQGRAICLSIPDVIRRGDMLRDTLSDGEMVDAPLGSLLLRFERFAPGFVHSLIERYIRAYCEGSLKGLLPLSASGLKAVAGDDIRIQGEILRGFMAEPEDEREAILEFLDRMNSKPG